MFCKNPSLRLDDLGIDDDLTFDVDMTGFEISADVQITAGKALYWRGVCKSIALDTDGALADYRLALIYVPHDKVSPN